MRNYAEEQAFELDALKEIYYNELKVISNKSPLLFSIKIRPQASVYVEPTRSGSDGEEDDDDYAEETDDDQDDDDQEVANDDKLSAQAGMYIELKFRLPERYPDDKPSVELIDSQNVDEYELERVMNLVNRRMNESLGTVMVFMIVCDVVEWLITKHDREANEIEIERERKQKELEAEATKKIIGTPVTEQTFLAWRAKFDAEMIKLKLEGQKQQLSDQGTSGSGNRLTGREMFESDKTLAESDLNFVEDLDQNQIEALLQDVDLQDEEFDEDILLEEDEDDDASEDSELGDESEEEEDSKE